MPSKPRDSSPERRKEKKEVKSEKTERPDRKDRERDRERDKDKEKKHRSSHTHRSNSTKEQSSSKTSLSSTGSKKRSSMPGVLEDQTDLSRIESRSKSSYPSFSKEHSKEAIGSRDVLNIFTPPATDVNASKEKLANLNRIINDGPPSPPLTDKNAGRPKPSPVKPVTVDTIVEEEKKDDSDTKSARRSKTRSAKSKDQLRKSQEEEEDEEKSPVGRVRSRKENGSTPLRDVTNKRREPSSPTSQPTRTVSPRPNDSTSETVSVLSSDATSIAPEQPSIQRPGSKVPPLPPQPVFIDHKIPTPFRPISVESQIRGQTPIEVMVGENSAMNTPNSMDGGPPPPPPPPNMPVNIPKVDYLLQNGGLYHSVPKNLLYAGKPMAVQQATMSPGQPPVVVANLFEPYNQLLHDFEKVMAKSGSLAVATGYRSVARRLLDRLEAVFARDLSAETCTCTICEYDDDREGDIRGVSWGEILELVSGRKDLPSWPPFAFAPINQGLGLNYNLQMPMQKLDIDVPEEYREHYIRQSQKTKQSVDRWLNRQNNDSDISSPPEEVDDETLLFAILTYISPDQRNLYKDLLGIVDQPLEPPRRAPSPEHTKPPRPTPTPAPQRIRPDYIITAGAAIQRLYRLSTPPRDPEVALYLLNNPSLHHPLATLAAVSSDEWDILISGRFDGFLRSGAEDDFPPPTQNSGRYTPSFPHVNRMPSRGATPAYGHPRSRQNSGQFTYPRPSTAPGYKSASGIDTGPGTGKSGAPIALDEETEIATLAEIERDIYIGMEALEDAFEKLHLRAESVRRAIRERSAGLAAAQQRRRQSEIEIRAGTPASQFGGHEGLQGGYGPAQMQWEVETDDGLGDDVSELAPDDSASNVSFARRRKHRRKHGGHGAGMKKQVTPVVGAIDEEEESEGYATRESSPEKR